MSQKAKYPKNEKAALRLAMECIVIERRRVLLDLTELQGRLGASPSDISKIIAQALLR